MKNIFKKIRSEAGFTLTEVMIGMTILTIAIVSATNLLIGLIGSNQNNVKVMQAYYLAQEGIESVRNIRDTNWLHNLDWLGRGDSAQLWGKELIVGEKYDVGLRSDAWNAGLSIDQESLDLARLARVAPWKVSGDLNGEIYRIADFGDVYLSASDLGGERKETGFSREVSIDKYEDCGQSDCEDFVLVTVKVMWTDKGSEKNVSLQTVLSDWKGGVF